MADNDCVNRFSLGECDFGKPVTISVRSFLDFCGHRGQKFALSLLCSHLSQCHHRAEWPVVCSGVHYYNIRSYLEYTNRLTALHWSRRKKGTEAHMSGIFQNIEPRRRRRPLRHLGYTCRLSLTLLGTTLLWWLRRRRTGEQTDWLDWLWLLVQSPIQLLPCSLHCSFSDGLLNGSHWGHGSQCGEPLRLS